MPDDVGGPPFPEGSDHGGADDEFASVVFDEAFISSASIHEPTAQERFAAAAQARAEAEQTRTRVTGRDPDDEDGFAAGHPEDEYSPWDDDGYETLPPEGYRSTHVRWHRTVAWVLAVIMGVGVLALTVAAVYRGASSGRQQPSTPPGTTRVDSPDNRGAPVSPGLPTMVQPAATGR